MTLLRLIFINLIFLSSAFYLAHRLINKKSARYIQVLIWLVLIGLSASFPAYFITRTTRDDGTPWLSDLITYGMGFFSLLLTFTVLRDILWLLFKYSPIQKHTSNERRHFLRSSSRIGVWGVTAAVFGTAVHNARGNPTLKQVSISIKDLPEALEGFSIVQISDVHVGQLKNQTEYLRQVVNLVNSCHADVVAVTGDVVDGSVAHLAQAVAPLGELKGKYGTFFVTGNHEYYSGANEWIEHFKSMGWHVLGNEHVVLEVKQQSIVIAGVHDLTAGSYIEEHECNPTAALKNAPSQAAFTLLLAHHPSTAKRTDDLNIDLQISGHTHAGQYFPATWLIHLLQPYTQGLHQRQNMLLYVNSGTGYWGPALRTTDVVGEVTLFKLTRAT